MRIRYAFCIEILAVSVLMHHAAPRGLRVSELDPERAVANLISDYASMDLADFAGALTSDFRFIPAYPEAGASPDRPLSRDDEIASADHLFHGLTLPTVVHLPRAKCIAAHVGACRLEWLHAPTDSISAVAVVRAVGVIIDVALEDGSSIRTGPTDQLFRLVRGAAERLPDGMRGTRRRWYVQCWIELAPGEREPQFATRIEHSSFPSGKATHRVGEPDVGGMPAGPPDSTRRAAKPRAMPTPAGWSASFGPAPGTLAVRSLMNPMPGSLDVAFALASSEPAQLDVMDVTGRRVMTRELSGEAARWLRLSLDPGPELAAGVYWLRLRQGVRYTTSRVVLMR